MKIEDVRLDNISYDFLQKRTKFEFSCYGEITSNLEEYLGKTTNIELKSNKRRSNTANSYLWVLLGELQEKLKIPKEDLYRQYVYGCGTYDIYQMPNDAVKRFMKSWGQLGLGWVCDVTETKGNMSIVFAYKGSSDYTKDEMAVLLSQVVDDCIAQGIPVKRQEDIESLIKEWS